MRLSDSVDKFIKEKYNVLFESDGIFYLDDFKRLEADLRKIKKEKFDDLDRIIFYRFETEFYSDFLNTGLTLRNIIECLKNVDIPFYNVLFFSNHYGIKKELDFLLKNSDQKITLIETCAVAVDISHTFDPIDIQHMSIIKPALCMLGGASRGHRHVLFNYFKKNNLLPLIATSYKN